MKILKQYNKKIKGKLSTFDRIIIKGYIRQLCNGQQFKTFLGRKMYVAFQGELGSDYRKRKEKIRIKHKMKSNSIKMYDKYSV